MIDIKPLTPPKQTLRKSPNVGAITAVIVFGLRTANCITSSAPVLVLPHPLPANISHILKSTSGVSCFQRPLAFQLVTACTTLCSDSFDSNLVDKLKSFSECFICLLFIFYADVFGGLA